MCARTFGRTGCERCDSCSERPPVWEIFCEWSANGPAHARANSISERIANGGRLRPERPLLA
eukprot:7675184-Lingulodinium_polyedra.AAC.1